MTSNVQTDIELAVEYAKQESNPMTICKMPSGWLFLALNQVLKGSCLLVCEPFVVSLESLEEKQRQQFITDMLLTSKAIQSVTGAERSNFLFLGNKDPVLHVHIIPRYSDEDEKYKAHGPWKYETYVKFDFSRDESLIAKIKEEIKAK